MRVAFSKRAADDIRNAGEYTRKEFGDRVARELEERIRAVLNQIREAPESGLQLEQRPDVRVMPLGRYPYRLFYRISKASVLVLHLRHTARQDWSGS